MGFEGPVGSNRKWVDKADMLQDLINEWWGLLPDGNERWRWRVPLHTDRRPKARRNLFWWIEDWMGDDLLRIDRWQHEDGKRIWVYLIRNPGLSSCEASVREVALMNAAIALAKRRRDG